MFKATGHENAYFPLFIPMSFLEKEAEHVEGFAKECAVVTHHRLEPDPDRWPAPAPEAKLEEPLIVRPTSETIIGATFARWVQSYRDLPILINQWANVVRWEMRTRMFLRTTEFLWQEGHTVHATERGGAGRDPADARRVRRLCRGLHGHAGDQGRQDSRRAVPRGGRHAVDRGHDAGPQGPAGRHIHFLGQNFAKAQEIKFQDESGELTYAWTTSWGVSTRLVGGLIMTHADDDGMVIPPKLAPAHVVILPIYKNDEERAAVLPYCESLKADLEAQTYDGAAVRVKLDDRDIRGGDKKWQWVKRGVPIRAEIGPRDVKGEGVFVARRDIGGKGQGTPRGELVSGISAMLDEMQQNLYDRAAKLRDDASVEIDSMGEFEKFFADDAPGGLAYCHFVDGPEMEAKLKAMKLTARCIPLDAKTEKGKCIFTGADSERRGVFARAY